MLCIEFKAADIEETEELDGNTLLDVDSHGNIVAITMDSVNMILLGDVLS